MAAVPSPCATGRARLGPGGRTKARSCRRSREWSRPGGARHAAGVSQVVPGAAAASQAGPSISAACAADRGRHRSSAGVVGLAASAFTGEIAGEPVQSMSSVTVAWSLRRSVATCLGARAGPIPLQAGVSEALGQDESAGRWESGRGGTLRRALEGAAHLGLHRLGRDAEDFGDLGIGEPLLALQREDQPAALGQPGPTACCTRRRSRLPRPRVGARAGTCRTARPSRLGGVRTTRSCRRKLRAAFRTAVNR